MYRQIKMIILMGNLIENFRGDVKKGDFWVVHPAKSPPPPPPQGVLFNYRFLLGDFFGLRIPRNGKKIDQFQNLKKKCPIIPSKKHKVSWTDYP